MNITTFNYTYPIRIEEPSEFDPITTIRIGTKTKPCITFLIIDGDCILQDFAFLEDNNETIEMLQTSLKWLFLRIPTIQTIELMDMSHIRLTDGSTLALPEDYMLRYGKTWYQYHFGAIPASIVTENILSLYRFARETQIIDNLPSLTGQSWNISRETVMKYSVEI